MTRPRGRPRSPRPPRGNLTLRLAPSARAWLEEVADRYSARGPAEVARLLLEEAARAATEGDRGAHRLPERVRIGLEAGR